VKRGLVLVTALATAVALAVPAIGAPGGTPGAKDDTPAVIKSNSSNAQGKLHPKLRDQVESGSTDVIYVSITAEGSGDQFDEFLTDSHTAEVEGASLTVGRVGVQELRKIASVDSVVSVVPIELRQTAAPPPSPEPALDQAPTLSTLQSFLNNLHKQEVPYSEAPPLAGSNFEELKDLAVLDAATHDFAEAWDAGYTGEGSTVAVLDGGTDWGHPDLIGTWQVGLDGWPLAFDPYGTLIWLVAPSFVDQGLSWYTLTEEKTEENFSQSGADARDGIYRVEFATKTGPARNFNAPTGTNTHEYSFPEEWAESGSVRLGSHPDEHLLQLFGERPAFIVVDTGQDDLYDTIYVDLDNDYEFADEKPVTKESPVSYRDMNGDGYTDLSGGLVYHISDGVTPLPGGPLAFGAAIVRAPGELIAWSGDFDPVIGGHGTLTASNVAGQGVINGKAPEFDDIGAYPGAVIGGAPDAKLAPFGDIYFSFDFSTQLGYLLANASYLLTGTPVDVTSNSYGDSSVDNDGYDAASQEADFWNQVFGGFTTALFSTGNGAPGFGTTAPPAPYTGIAVGASTQFGGTGWDSMADISQMLDDDVMVWSNRGPGATGSNGVDLVADGAFSAGDLTLNTVLDGNLAWNTWGGTSRSTPVAAGATALVYQAAREGGGIPPGFMFEAKNALVSSAEDLGYDSWIQGGGSLNAFEAVETINGASGMISATEWRPGDYRGDEYQVFTHLMAPGDSDTNEFSVSGAGSYSISDRQLVRTDLETMTFTSTQLNKEGAYHFNAPNYLIDISELVSDHSSADVMVIRATHPYSTFDGNGDYNADQLWRLLTYNWTDVNGDGNLWTDQDNDGAVDVKTTATSSNIDGFADINYAASEIDEGEYVRFMYHRGFSNTVMNFVRDPAQRMDDGIFIGLQHPNTSGSNSTTPFQIQIEFYENADWNWVETSPSVSGGGSFSATMNVPADAEPGMYNGAITLTDGPDVIVLPVSLTVAPTVEQDENGQLTSLLNFGGADVGESQSNYLYNNGAVFDAIDWSWRAESGDWRFFYFDVPEEPADGSLLLVETTWDDEAPPTDLDTLIFGRGANTWQLDNAFPIGGPYILDTVAKSTNANTGGGVWRFDTATGSNTELVAGALQEGLHAIVEHSVNHSGDPFLVPFEINAGGATVDPASVLADTTQNSGDLTVTFESALDLNGLVAEGYGLSQPSITTETAAQDDPNDPSSASVKVPLTVEHAASIEAATVLDQDLDLFLVYDADGDGTFTNAEIVASSATGTGNEHIFVSAPPDGDYEVWAQGWQISGNPEFQMLVDVVQGFDLSISGVPDGAIPADTPVELTVAFDKEMEAGQSYFGVVQLGPPSAPSAISVPVQINRN
jgi:hypothetical protein